MFAVALVLFIQFMFKLSVPNMLSALISITIATALYISTAKAITHDKGYTAIQAITFYLACRKEGFGKIEMCKKKTVRFKEIASTFDFAKNLELEDLYEMHKIAYGILYERKANK